MFILHKNFRKIPERTISGELPVDKAKLISKSTGALQLIVYSLGTPLRGDLNIVRVAHTITINYSLLTINY